MSTPLEDDSVSPGDLIEAVHISQLFPIVEALEDNQTSYREDIGIADAYKVDFSGSGQANEIDAYQAGQQIVFKAANTNTGASTLQIAGPSGDLTAVDLTKFGNNALDAGDIAAGQLVVAIYNDAGSGRFEMIGSAPVAPAPPDPSEDGSGLFREDDGSAANLYEVDASGLGSNPREISALENGMIITFKAAHSNTGASVLDVIGPAPGGSLGLFPITRQDAALVANDIKVDTLVTVIYSDEGSGRFELLGSQPIMKPQPNDLGDALFRQDTGSTTNAYKVTFNSTHLVSSYSDGLVVNFRVRSGGDNTGASTFQIVGPSGALTAKPLTRRNGNDLHLGDLIEDQMVSVIYNGDQDRFELMGGAPSGSGGGGGSSAFVGAQFSSIGQTLTATVQTDINWDNDFNEGMDHSGYSEWIYALETGYYEVGMVLALELPSADSIDLQMIRGDHTSETLFAENKFDVPAAGFCTFSLASVLIYLEAGEGFKWKVTPANDDPEILSGTLSTRCTVRLVSSVPSLCCMVGMYGDQSLTGSTPNTVYWHDEVVDPGAMHDDYSEWLDAPQDGYYEAGLVLNMEMTAAESLIVKLIYDDGSESDYCVNQMDGAIGNNVYTLSSVYLQMNEGDRIKWTVEPTLDAPTIFAGYRATRTTMKFLGDL